MLNVGDIVRYKGASRGGLLFGHRCRIVDINTAGSASAAIVTMPEGQTFCVETFYLREESQLNFDDFQELCRLIQSKQRIQAIKLLRSVYGAGLGETKELVGMIMPPAPTSNYEPNKYEPPIKRSSKDSYYDED